MKTNFHNFAQQPRAAKRLRLSPSAVSCGFTLLETLLVVSIAIVIMAFALPNFANMVTAARWRGEVSSLSGLFQACRSQAVHKNETRHLIFTTSGGRTVAYVDVPGSTTGLTTSLTQIWLPSQFNKASAPTSAPTPLDSSIMWNDGLATAPNTTSDLCFNSRGIPCTCPASVNAYCAGITNGYAFYFTLSSQYGTPHWAAVGVSPAGRIKTYFWNGSAWSN